MVDCAFICVILLVLTAGVRAMDEVICGGFDMRNDPAELWIIGGTEAERLKNCTVVEGDVRLVMLTRNDLTSQDYHSLPTIREITGFLLVFQV